MPLTQLLGWDKSRFGKANNIPSTYKVGELVDVINKKEPGTIRNSSNVVDENGEPTVAYQDALTGRATS